MNKRRLAICLISILLILPTSLVFGKEEGHPDIAREPTHLDEVSFTLDGVELTLSTPFLPSQRILIPEPGDPVQVVNIIQKEPSFRSLTLTAIPYGTKPSVEIFPIARPDTLEAYRSVLTDYRRTQGGGPISGPTITLFDEEVTSIASTVMINIDVFELKPVRIYEWIVEGGNRFWLFRISQEIQMMDYLTSDLADEQKTEDLTSINLSAETLEVPSTSLDTSATFYSPITTLSSGDNLPFPSWWDGDCDYNTYHSQTGDPSYPLGGVYRGVKACGPRPYFDNAEHALTQFNPGWWGVLEWECVELSMRFLYLSYGVQTYQANGNQVVTNYSGSRLIKINDGTPGIAPQPNDVLSLGPETPVGHTSVVTSSNVDQQGNGTISVLEENSSPTGTRTYSVVNWEIQSSYTVIGWLHDPGNGDYTPPTGDILEPSGNQTLDASTIHLEGWASDDDSGLNSAQFIANYDGSWHEVGPGFNNLLFNYDWDWCEDNVPDGPVSLALKLIDNQGNQTPGLPGIVHLIKNHSCPSNLKCISTTNQVALYSDPNYGGNCKILDIGNYPDIAAFPIIGNNQTKSILVGDDVLATIFTELNFTGRRETVNVNDPNLSENLIGSNSLTSIKVIYRDTLPEIPSPIWPTNLSTHSEFDSVTLFWNDEGGAILTRVSIDGPSLTETSSWEMKTTWSLGALDPGVYSWRIQGRNSFGDSAWSPWYFFTISEDATSTITSVTAPFLDTLEGDTSGWKTTGLWHLSDNDSHSSDHSWWYSQPVTQTYNTQEINFGSLSSPLISLTSNPDPYFLEFWSKHETEGHNQHWDQRRVQISLDGNEFMDIYQLIDGPTGIWIKVRIDLSPYYTSGTNHDLRVRFYFTSVDKYNNDFFGWYIDDIQVSTSATETCNDLNEPNNLPSSGTLISYGDSVAAEICPGMDRDVYTFWGTSGDQIVVDVDAKSTGSTLDSIVHLLDADGTSILAVHDDEVIGIRQDPHLGYRLPRDGNYFLSVQAWDTPMGTGPYTLTLFTDGVNPSITSLWPNTGTYLPAAEISILVSAEDNQSGISHAEFWGFADGWNLIGEDWDGSDGWQTPFDTSGLAEGQQIEFYARTYDWAGNWVGIPAWDLTLDFSHPETTSDPLPNPSETTAIHLDWTHTDNLSGIRSSHVRYRKNSEAWLNLGFSTDTREWWFVGEAGNNYIFRIRAIDNAGNIEPFLEGAEVFTSIPAITSLCSSPDSWDESPTINDNALESATPLPSSWQTHNFCNPETTNRLFDVDWYTFEAVKDHIYTINTLPLHQSTGVVMRLFEEDGITMLSEIIPDNFGDTSDLSWKATYDGIAFIELSHLDGSVAGNAAAYQVSYQETSSGPIFYFPLIYK